MKIESLGIEIRKTSAMPDLYKEVDRVLSGNDAITIAAQTTAHALQKMLKPSTHFSVCTIRDCAKVCNICIPEERMQVYNAIHCVNWSEMTPSYREMVIAMVLDDFRPVLTYSEIKT